MFSLSSHTTGNGNEVFRGPIWAGVEVDGRPRPHWPKDQTPRCAGTESPYLPAYGCNVAVTYGPQQTVLAN